VKIRQFITSRIFFKQVALSVAIIAILMWITMWAISLYTHHGEKIIVPDFSGLNMEQAQEQILKNELQYSIMDSVFRSHLAPGTILDQSPAPGMSVKQNRTIFFTINSKHPEKIRLPKLVDYSFRQAIAILETNGFRIGRLEYIPSSYRNLVLQQKTKGDTIATGTLIEKGSTIDLVMGLGKNATPVLVPTLIGLNQNQAKRKIILSNLNQGRVHYDNSVITAIDSAQAKVWRQKPTFGQNIRIRPGSDIHIWLTRDPQKISQADSLVLEKQKLVQMPN